MSSAGQSKNVFNENKKRVRLASDDKENVRKSDQNALPITLSRYSTRASLNINQQCKCAKYSSDNSRRVTNIRQPLSDLVPNQESNFKTVHEKNKFDTFKKPPARRNTENHERPSTSAISDQNRTYIKSSETRIANFDEESAFWTSFLPVHTTIDGPHMKVKKFITVVGNGNPIKSKENSKPNESIIYDAIPSLRKKTLKKHLMQPSKILGVVNLDPFTNEVSPVELYSLDYLNDIIYNIIKKQETNTLQAQFLDRCIKYLDHRSSVINWLVKLHQYWPSEAGVFFMSVRLFDKILTLLDIPETNYQLTAMAAYWISLKYQTANFISGSRLIELSGNAFTLECLLEMEKNILLILQFDITLDEPIIFVYYYIYILQLCESSMIAFCSSYLLELLTLDFNCNTFPLSLQAASAVFLSIKFLNIKERVWKHVEKSFGYHVKSEMFEIQKIMMKNIMLTNHEDSPYKESLLKYSTQKYGKVAILIRNILEKWYNINDISLLI